MSDPTGDCLDRIETLADLFHWRVNVSPQRIAYRQFDPDAGTWVSFSWRDIGVAAGRWKKGLEGLNLPRGSRVAMLLPNGTLAVGVDQGAMGAGLVPVPLHALDNPGSIVYILNDSEAAVLVVRTAQEWMAIAGVGEAMPHLRLVVTAEPAGNGMPARGDGPRVAEMRSWLPAAGALEPPASVDPGDLAAIVYTSGTTGRPKGVMLTHRNVLANVRSVLASVPAVADDVFLSFLPLSHTFERTAGYYLPVAAGSCVAYVRSVSEIAADLKTVRPTVLVSVPRIYERFYSKLRETLAHSSRVTRGLFRAAEAVGWRRFCRRQGLVRDASAWGWADALAWPVLDRLAARKVRAQFGGRIRAAVSGGAPISEPVARCFLGLGVPLLQGYGMTETAPVVAVNTPEDNWPQTVGKALPGVEVRIGENLELQVRGDNVMRGYWGRPDDTKKVMTSDGWLMTGDQAALEAGRVRILGRIKEIIVTSTGEKIAPVDLEVAIASDELFDQAWVVGEGRPFLSVFLVLNPGQWRRLAAALGLPPADASPSAGVAGAAVMERIERATRRFPRYAVPRAAWATLEPWTVQNGLLTPTLKLKRNNLQHRFRSEIDAIYRGHGPGSG